MTVQTRPKPSLRRPTPAPGSPMPPTTQLEPTPLPRPPFTASSALGGRLAAGPPALPKLTPTGTLRIQITKLHALRQVWTGKTRPAAAPVHALWIPQRSAALLGLQLAVRPAAEVPERAIRMRDLVCFDRANPSLTFSTPANTCSSPPHATHDPAWAALPATCRSCCSQ